MAIRKIKIMGAVLELPAKQRCQFSPLTSKIGPNGLNWQCCLVGKQLQTALSFFDFFNCHCSAKPSFQVKSIATLTPTFFTHNNSFIANVQLHVILFLSFFVNANMQCGIKMMFESQYILLTQCTLKYKSAAPHSCWIKKDYAGVLQHVAK